MSRVGAVPYLNGKPLVWGMEEDTTVSVSSHVPSELARMLEHGEIAAGLVSVAALFSNPALRLLPGIGICCDGPVESVKIFLRDGVENITRVALDTSSLTSVILGRIVLRERYGVEPCFVDMPPDIEAMLDTCEAAVLIGDPAMRVPPGRWRDLDLGAEWKALTGLPFVFAGWAVNPDLTSPELVDALYHARDRGLRSLNDIAVDASERLDLPISQCRHYLTEIMEYDLTERHISAIRLFQSKAREYGLSVDGPNFEFLAVREGA